MNLNHEEMLDWKKHWRNPGYPLWRPSRTFGSTRFYFQTWSALAQWWPGLTVGVVKSLGAIRSLGDQRANFGRVLAKLYSAPMERVWNWKIQHGCGTSPPSLWRAWKHLEKIQRCVDPFRDLGLLHSWKARLGSKICLLRCLRGSRCIRGNLCRIIYRRHRKRRLCNPRPGALQPGCVPPLSSNNKKRVILQIAVRTLFSLV